MGELLKKYVIIVLLAVSLFLLILPTGISSCIKMAIASPLSPLQKTTFQIGTTVNGYFHNIFYMWKNANDHKKLKRYIFLLKNKVVQQKSTIKKLRNEIKNLTHFYDNLDEKKKPVVATVISYDLSDFRKSVMINIGSKHGVAADNVVISGGALVGRISEVGSSSSRVKIITDPSSRVPARILETREHGIVEGTSGPLCKLKYIPRISTVEKDHKVVSSNTGDFFSESIYIADVLKSEIREGEPFRHIELLPRLNLTELETVVVIRK